LAWLSIWRESSRRARARSPKAGRERKGVGERSEREDIVIVGRRVGRPATQRPLLDATLSLADAALSPLLADDETVGLQEGQRREHEEQVT